MIGNKIPYIVWEWQYTKNERTLRIVHSSYSPIKKNDQSGNALNFWKDLRYEISAGYDGMKVKQFNHVGIDEFFSYISKTTTYFEWLEVFNSLIVNTKNALEGYLRGRCNGKTRT